MASVIFNILLYANIILGPMGAISDLSKGSFFWGGFLIGTTLFAMVVLIRKAIIDHD